MNYSYGVEYKDFTKVVQENKVNFENDTIYFKSIKAAFRHLYYAQNNKFLIEFNKELLGNKNLITVLRKHGAKIEIVYPRERDRIRYSLILNRLLKQRHNICEFKPKIKKLKLCNSNQYIYILDGYYVNDIDWDYVGGKTNATKSIDKFKFNFTLLENNEECYVASEEYEVSAFTESYPYSLYKNSINKLIFAPKVFIYDCQRIDSKLQLKIFLQGYEYIENKFNIETRSKFKIKENDDWKYYSKISNKFKDNFLLLELDDLNSEISFRYRDKCARIIFSRNLSNDNIYNDMYFNLKSNRLSVRTEINQYKTKKYKEFEKLQNTNIDKFYLFMDRNNKGDDNAEALYRYYKKNSNKQIYFVVEEDSECWNRLKNEDFNLVAFGSLDHKKKYLTAEKIITSHAARRIYDPFYPNREFINLEKHKFIFLQHGVIMGNHHGFLDKVNNKIDLIITSTEEEANIIRNFSGFENVQVTGLARFDNYQVLSNDKIHKQIEVEENYIVYAPSWNVKYKDNLNNSDYKREIEKVLNSEVLNQILISNKLKLKFVLHPEFINENLQLKNKFNYQLMTASSFRYSQLLNDAVGLITDYSSIFFDFLYQKKIVILHKPYELHHDNDKLLSYKQMLYETTNIQELDNILKLINSRTKSMQNLTYEKNIFEYVDDQNCMRNAKQIEKL